MSDGTQTNRAYALGHSARETARLEKMAALYNPSTHRLLAEAGVEPGMKVLDVGSGAGDVALLAADLVGPTGTVIGVEANPVLLDTAQERVHAAGLSNVRFICGDLHSVSLADDFDAVVGRLILLHMTDPATTLRSLVGHLRRDGIVVFQDIDMTHEPLDVPPSPLHNQSWNFIVRVFSQAGIDLAMGLKLHHVFVDAGLPAPQMHLSAPIGTGPEWAGYDFAAQALRVALDMAQTRGWTTADEVVALDVDTFAARWRDEVGCQNGVITLAPYVGAWTRKL
jgi:cyclopropane fatty-acyl-phospholipid synthase-like methyltransferase